MAIGKPLKAFAAACAIGWLTLPVKAETQQNPPMMAIEGKVAVDARGNATYTIPIIIPPGTAGVQPIVSLQYSSGSGDGFVGVGWSLEIGTGKSSAGKAANPTPNMGAIGTSSQYDQTYGGVMGATTSTLGGQASQNSAITSMPAINRCPRTVAQDGVHGGINYDMNDRFCMGGQRLIVTSGSYGANNSEYRTEVESFSKIVAHGSAGNGPQWFEVHTKSGEIIELGNSSDSRLLAVGTSTVRTWAASKISDTVGNYLTVTYTNDSTNGQIYPTRIDYTGNSSASQSPYNSIRFTYTSRPDVTPQYQAGSLQQTTVLLTDITTYQGSNVVHHYALTYRLGSNSPTPNDVVTRSRLTTLTLCDGGSNCLPATTFTWQGGATTFSASTGAVTPSLLATGTGYYKPISPGDYDADGLTDISPNYVCPGTGSVYLGTSTDRSFTTANMQTNASGSTTSFCSLNDAFADWNGDGYTDSASSWFNPPGTNHVLENNKSGLFNSISSGGSSPAVFSMADFNGDGRADYWEGGASHSTNSNGNGTFTVDTGYTVSGALPDNSNVIIGDYDGDGCSDVLLFGLGIATNTITYFCNPATATATAPSWSNAKQFISGDFNGDGKSDVLYIAYTGLGTSKLYLSTGVGLVDSGFSVPSGWDFYAIVTGDWNGDGRTDIALIAPYSYDLSGGGPYNHLVFVSTGTGFTQVATIANNDAADTQCCTGTNIFGTVADWNNDGNSDIWLQKPSGQEIYLISYTPELMTSIDNGIGGATTITYDRLNKNGSFYTKGTGASYPTRDVDGPQYVVKELDVPNGVGGAYVTTYKYAGAQTSQDGRGALGFASVTATDPQSGIVTTTNYRQDFPYIGLISSQTQVHSATTLKSVTNTWASNNVGPGTLTVVTLSQSVVSGNDLNGATLPTTTTAYSYDSYSNPTQVSVSISGGSGGSSVTTNTYNNDTTYWLIGQLLTKSVNNTVGSSSYARSWAYSYQAVTGLLTEEVIEPNDAAHRLYTDYTSFDAFGNRLVIQQSGSGIATRTTTLAYTSYGQFLASNTNALSQAVSWTYDARFGLPVTSTDLNGLVTSASYDWLGRQTAEVRPDGTKTYLYDLYCSGTAGGSYACPSGAFTHISVPYASDGTTQNGHAVWNYFDLLSRVVIQDANAFANGQYSRLTNNIYNSTGQVSQSSRPYRFSMGESPQWSSFTYDDLYRVTDTVFPDGSQTTNGYNGLTTTVTNDLSQTVTMLKNAQGLIATVTDPASKATTYVYDAFDNLLTVTDPVGNVTSNSYDVRGNRIATSDPDLGSWTYSYDILNQLIAQLDGKGQPSSLTYDLLGRVTQKADQGITSTWTWDSATHGVGLLASATTGSSYTKTLTYDALSRPDSTTLGIGGTNYFYSTSYTADSQIAQVIYPSGLPVKYSYSALGDLTRLSDGDNNAIWTINDRNADGQLLSQTMANGNDITQTFNAATGRIASLRAGSGGAAGSRDYGFDAIGNLISRVDAVNSVTEKFCYDSLNRLTEYAAGSSVTACSTTQNHKTVGYSSIGNITSKSDVGTYSYPSATTPRPHAVSSITGTVNGKTNPTFSYDGNGAMVAGPGTPQGAANDNTIYINDPVTGAMAEKYTNASGTVWRDYVKVDGQVVALRTSSINGAAEWGAVTWNSFNWGGPTGPQWGSVNWNAFNWTASSNSPWQYFVLDSLNSVIAVSASGGATTQQSYDPWGRRRNTNGSDSTNCTITSSTTRGFTNQEEIDTVCLVNLNARVYDPTIARFMAADPVTGYPYDMQALNRYSYVNNQPLVMTDPTGLDTNTEDKSTDPVPQFPLVQCGEKICITVIEDGDRGPKNDSNNKQGSDDQHWAPATYWQEAMARIAPYVEGLGPLLERFGRSPRGPATGPTIPRPTFPYPKNPTDAPSPDFKWVGRGPVGSRRGNWYNPKTDESVHPDHGHGPPIGPHVDWRAPNGTWYRYFPDGSVAPKRVIVVQPEGMEL